MVKKNKGGKLIILIGVLTITIVTYCAFNREKITYKYEDMFETENHDLISR